MRWRSAPPAQLKLSEPLAESRSAAGFNPAREMLYCPSSVPEAQLSCIKVGKLRHGEMGDVAGAGEQRRRNREVGGPVAGHCASEERGAQAADPQLAGVELDVAIDVGGNQVAQLQAAGREMTIGAQLHQRVAILLPGHER